MVIGRLLTFDLTQLVIMMDEERVNETVNNKQFRGLLLTWDCDFLCSGLAIAGSDSCYQSVVDRGRARLPFTMVKVQLVDDSVRESE